MERQSQQEVRTHNEFTLVKKKIPSDDVRTSFLRSSQCAVLIPFPAAYSSVPFTAQPYNGLFNDAVNSSHDASSSDRLITQKCNVSKRKRSSLCQTRSRVPLNILTDRQPAACSLGSEFGTSRGPAYMKGGKRRNNCEIQCCHTNSKSRKGVIHGGEYVLHCSCIKYMRYVEEVSPVQSSVWI